MNNLTNAMINQMIDKTKNESVIWTNASDLRPYLNNANLLFLFGTNEFHEVKENKSFITNTGSFYLSLIEETFLSGKDGSTDSGVNVYLMETLDSEIYPLEIQNDLIIELQQTIIHSSKISFKHLDLQRILINYLKN